MSTIDHANDGESRERRILKFRQRILEICEEEINRSTSPVSPTEFVTALGIVSCAGITNKDLASRLDASPLTVHRWTCGKNRPAGHSSQNLYEKLLKIVAEEKESVWNALQQLAS